MKAIEIIHDSFKPVTVTANEVGDFYAERINGTVEVQYFDEVIRTYAIEHESGNISALGFMGKYRTGNKLWRVSISDSFRFDRNGEPVERITYTHFGRDDRSGNFTKSGIFFAPKQFYAR